MTTLPSGWMSVTLREISDDISYGFTASANANARGPKLLRITDIQRNQVNWNTVPRCETQAPEKFQLFSGDIVIARTGATTGKSFLVRSAPNGSIFASYLIRIRAKQCITPEFLNEYFQSVEYWSQIQVVSKGTAQPGANASVLGDLRIPLPPLAEQQRVISKIGSLSAKSKRARTYRSCCKTGGEISANNSRCGLPGQAYPRLSRGRWPSLMAHPLRWRNYFSRRCRQEFALRRTPAE